MYGRGVRRRRTWPALLAFAGLGCRVLTDPALPEGATHLTPPPVFSRWWAMTEACSGASGDMSDITWYVANGSASISNGHEGGLAGYYSPLDNRIVLADTADISPAQIRHEMLHALLGASISGHPREQFLGRCAGTVSCLDECISDAGPPQPLDPASVAVPPDALLVTGVVDPSRRLGPSTAAGSCSPSP